MSKKKRQPSHRGPSAPRRLSTEIEEAIAQADASPSLETGERLEALARRFPHRIDLLTALVNLYHDLHDLRGYEAACERLLPLTPDDPDLWLGLAGAYLGLGHPVLALRTFAYVLEDWPEHERAAEVQATIDELEPVVAELVAEDLGFAGHDALDLAARHEQALVFMEQGRYLEARKEAEQLLRRHPDFVPALNNLSQLEAIQGRFPQAVATAQRALAIDSGNAHALSNLVRYFCLSGRLEEARPFAERLEQADLERPDATLKVVEALSYLGDDEGVVAAWQRAQNEDPSELSADDALLCHLIAVASQRLGRTDEAQQLWQEALRLAPELSEARGNVEDLRKPVGEQHAPWAFGLANWMLPQIVRELASQFEPLAASGSDERITRSVRRFLRQHREVSALVPVLLDRGDPVGRELALRMALLSETPELLEALRDFALGQRGPDALRQQAARAASGAGLIPAGLVRLWLEGEWREVLLLEFEISGEPQGQHREPVQALLTEALETMNAGDADRAERLLQEALELEPDAPDLLNNLAVAYELQGRRHEAQALIREIYARHPDYLFARVGMARLHVQRGEHDEARSVLEPLLSRRQFHVVEFGALCAAEIDLFHAEGNVDAARSWLELWAGADPDNPALADWRNRLSGGGWLRRLLGKR